ncbi:MAG: PEP-utilizing enzyme [Actinomycetota bacterium]
MTDHSNPSADPTDAAPDRPGPDWTPPGPGSWTIDRSHGAPSPTPVLRRIASTHTAPTYREVFTAFGTPMGTIDFQYVNGAQYRRLVPLIAPDADKGKPPPNPVLWLASRLHPELRRRNRTAERVVTEKTFIDDIDHWVETERHEWVADNRVLQDVEPGDLDDEALAGHLADLDARLVAGWVRHHLLHANDLGPIGDLLVHAEDWGLDVVSVMDLLQGSSPATVSTARHGRAMADGLRAAGVDPATIESLADIDGVPEASAALDEYLDTYGWRLVSDYDINGLVLHELPSAVVALVRRSATGDGGEAARQADTERLRSELRGRATDPELFDTLLDDARTAYGVRDDNGPLTWAWPAGLTRRAYLEAGRRLAERGAIDDADLVFEADIDEVRALLGHGEATAPSAAELTSRAAHRRWEKTLVAPDVLGPMPPEPDVSPLPAGLRRLMRILLTVVARIDPEPVDRPPALHGLGIGTEPYRGTARVTADAAEAVAALQPGDILVAPFTAPSFNAVLAIAGGVVVQEGGLLCHAAVMARELGIPAVVGCSDAMATVADGAHIEVDPVAGVVRVLEPS